METINNNLNDFNELDDLRQQINELRAKVDSQGRLNEDFVKKTIQGKMRGLHHNLFWYCLIVGLFVPFIIWDFIESGMSWAFILYSILMFAVSFAAEYLINRMKVNRMGDNLMETAHKLMQMKKNRKTMLKIGFCEIAIWFPWYVYEIFKTLWTDIDPASRTAVLTFLVLVMIAAGLVGAFIGMSFYRKMQRTNDEMIAQINELTNE